MKTLILFLCLALALSSCKKDNPVSSTEDPNGYSNYELYLDGIKVYADCDDTEEGEFFYSIGIYDYKDSLIAMETISKDYRKKAADGEFIDINRTLKFKLINSQNFKLKGIITEYNSFFSNVEVPFAMTYVYPYNSKNMASDFKLDGKDGYSGVALLPNTGCVMTLFFKLTKV